MDAKDFYEQVGPMIAAYPEAATTLVLLCFGLGWALASLLNRREIAAIRAESALKDARVAKASGAGDPIKQHGAEVGTAIAARLDHASGTAHIGNLFGGPLFNREQEFELQGYILKLVGWGMYMEADGGKGLTVTSATCTIVRKAP